MADSWPDALFRGTAADYDQFRPVYAEALLEALRGECAGGAVLDIGCGTGQIACALGEVAASVVAVDAELEMVELLVAKASRLGMQNIECRVGKAEQMNIDIGFDLITVGNAFHRFDRDLVAGRLFDSLGPSGVVALAWSYTPWTDAGPTAWQRAAAVVVDEWRRRVAPAGIPSWRETVAGDPHTAVLERAGFIAERRRYETVRTWTLESLIGFARSTSVLSAVALGDHSADFDQAFADAVTPHTSDGVFVQHTSDALDLGRRPGPVSLRP